MTAYVVWLSCKISERSSDWVMAVTDQLIGHLVAMTDKLIGQWL